ncbi:MAG: hypothetical protein ACFFCQ_02315 [Promethearchaeota archaeon]
MTFKVLLLGDGAVGKTSLAAHNQYAYVGHMTIFFEIHPIKTSITSETSWFLILGDKASLKRSLTHLHRS